MEVKRKPKASGKGADHHQKTAGVEGGSISEVEDKKHKERKHGHGQNADAESEKEKHDMEKIEALCRQFGVPDPGELYIIPRDFQISGKPNLTQFDIQMPAGLARWVDEEEFEYTVGKINFFFAQAEDMDCRTVWNGVCKFLTCFMIRACQRTRTERAIIRVKNFIVQQNQEVYHPKGFHIVEPAARGLRHLEFRSITYYSMKYFLEHEDDVQVTESEAHVAHSHLKPTVMHGRGSVMSHF